MSQTTSTVVAVTMPQVNVNDEEVALIGWHVETGQRVEADAPLCEVETSKSVGDVPAPTGGVVWQVASVGDTVGVGQIIAYIGPSADAIDAYMAKRTAPSATRLSDTDEETEEVSATAGAIALARAHGIDIHQIKERGKVRRADVERYLAEHPESRAAAPQAGIADEEPLPPILAEMITDEGQMPAHQWSITKHLSATQQRIVSACVMMDVDMTAAGRWMDGQRQAGRIAGPMPLLLKAVAAAVATCPTLLTFRVGRHIYRYNSMDIAYTARNAEARLFTPVIREADRLSLDELADQCARLNMAVFRGELDPDDMTGGCLTVSALADQPVRCHIGLQNAYQSALLTAGAVRDEVVLREGQPVAQPTLTLILSYDHGLLNGWEAATALEAAKTALEAINV